jgi:GT2 family glycosyltransferase
MTVVVVNYNGRTLLETCLPALRNDLREEAGSEIIVVDNGSSDDSVTWLRRAWPEVTVIELGENRGYPAACNAGAKVAQSSIVVLHNNDAIVQPGWSAALRAALHSAPDVVIAGGLTVFLDRPSYVNSAGIRIAISGAALDIGFGRQLAEVDTRERDVAGVSGVSMAVRREWFEAVGGCDETFFMYFEDADLCLRAWVEGHRVRFAPGAVVTHAFGGTTGSRYASERNYYGSRNRLLMAAKSFGMGSLMLAVILSIIQDVTVVLWLLATGRMSLARAAASGKLRGTLDGLLMLPRYLREPRRSLRRQRAMGELRALGVIDPFGVSIREFGRMRRLGLRG